LSRMINSKWRLMSHHVAVVIRVQLVLAVSLKKMLIVLDSRLRCIVC